MELFALLLLALVSAPVAMGQGLGGAMFFSGTVTTNTAGQHWAYIVWQATDSALLMGQPVAVYAKPGGPGSADPFTLAGIADYQTEPRTIALLNQRAAQLGDDPVMVGDSIDQLFSGLVPDPALALEDKLAAVLEGSLGLTEHYDNLTFLGRRHPAVALAMGQAWAERIDPGTTTFELRQYDLAAGRPGIVLGRVTVTAGSPVVLPAPGQPQSLAASNAMEHLNIRLRWTAPAALRRLSLLQFGYNVYRMPEGFAVSNGYHATPPSVPALRSLVASGEGGTRQVNNLPVLIDEEDLPPDAEFFVDDNGRFDPGGTTLVDGTRFYYFVTARDLLGRDGLVSPGGLASVCDRFPPPVPTRVRVEAVRVYTNGAPTNHLLVTWRQNDNSGAHTTSNYFIYRWNSASDPGFRSMTNPTAGLLDGPVAHISGQRFNSYLDTTVPATNGVSYQYTVRASDDAACGINLSGHSGPAFGNLQDWSGPAAPTGAIFEVSCLWPSVYNRPSSVSNRPATNIQFRVVCTRITNIPEIIWAEFLIADGDQNGTNGLAVARHLGRYYFGATSVTVSVDTALDNDEFSSATFYCRVGSDNGKISTYAWQDHKDQDGLLVIVNFRAEVSIVTGPAGEPCDEVGPPDEDDPTPGGLSWTNRWTLFEIPGQPDAVEYRVYRSINGGELSLVLQGTNEPDVDITNLTDRVGGALHCADVCYYSQQLDVHGNASPYHPMGCVYAGIVVPDAPQQVSMISTGTVEDPQLHLAWEMDPPGIERFEVWVGLATSAPPNQLAAALSTNINPENTVLRFMDNGVEKEAIFGRYLTGRIGVSFGQPEERLFGVTFDVVHGQRYYAFVRALTECAEGSDSDVRSGIWTVPATGPDVPWPARPLPEVAGDFHPNLSADFIPPTANANRQVDVAAVRIGEFYTQYSTKYPRDFPMPGTNPPSDYVYTDQNGGRVLMPFALYRYQVANAKFPNAPGDVIQVSPLMEDIAYGKSGVTLYVRDPFIDVVASEEDDNLALLYLIDTQPTLRGAAYRYLLVQFGLPADEKSEGEPIRVIPTNELTIP